MYWAPALVKEAPDVHRMSVHLCFSILTVLQMTATCKLQIESYSAVALSRTGWMCGVYFDLLIVKMSERNDLISQNAAHMLQPQ